MTRAMRMMVAGVMAMMTAGVARAGECPCPSPSPGLDPNYSRLLFAPTGRPLRAGDGYFSDYELLFPGVAYGLTDNVTLAGGVSVIPGLGLGEQLMYVSPKIGWNLGPKAAVSVGGLFARAGADGEYDSADSLGIGFAVGTFGGVDRSVSIGAGVLKASGDDSATPLLMLGGTSALSRHVAMVGETWIRADGQLRASEQPIGLGLRFFGDRLSADVGVILVGELLDEGFPLPWASITYHFSGKRNGSHGVTETRRSESYRPSFTLK